MAESRPAPGHLETIRSFVNTRDIDRGTDELSSVAELASWLADQDLIPAGEASEVLDQDLADALELREAFRGLLLANNDGEPAPMAARSALNRAARKSRFSLSFETEGASLQPEAPGVSGALGQLVSIVADSMAAGTWDSFKACRSDDCEWAFYDYARNHSRKWCEMAVCGNREKARTYRERHAET